MKPASANSDEQKITLCQKVKVEFTGQVVGIVFHDGRPLYMVQRLDGVDNEPILCLPGDLRKAKK
jgi:hypothetical protein